MSIHHSLCLLVVTCSIIGDHRFVLRITNVCVCKKTKHKCFYFLFTGCKVNVVKPQQNKLWLLEIITIQNTISDTIDLENNAYVRKKINVFL